jgi:hypothetical protein
MNWLRKRVIAWVREDWDEANRFSARLRPEAVETHDDSLDDPIRFELQGVVGGHLLKVRQPYNHKIEKSPSTTYIIQSGEDIGAKIAKIINLELIK